MEKWEVKDEDLKYGIINHKEMSPFADNIMRYMIADVSNIKNQYMILGRHLSEFKRNKYYLDFGFDTLEDCIQANLGLDKSSMNRCINVFRRFGHKAVIDKYKEYNYSQLVEMLPMQDEELKQIEPDMSVRKIRDIKAAFRFPSTKPVNSSLILHGRKITVDGEPDRITRAGFMELIMDYVEKVCKKYENIEKEGSLYSGKVGTKEIYIRVEELPGMNGFEAGRYKIVIQKMK